MKRYGFTQSEFDRTKAEFLRQAEATYANRNDLTNGQYVQTYLANYKKIPLWQMPKRSTTSTNNTSKH